MTIKKVLVAWTTSFPINGDVAKWNALTAELEYVFRRHTQIDGQVRVISEFELFDASEKDAAEFNKNTGWIACRPTDPGPPEYGPTGSISTVSGNKGILPGGDPPS